MPVALGQNYLHLTFNRIKAMKPTPVNMRNCQIWLSMHIKYYRKMNLLKVRGPQILLCLYAFRPIASKQLNSLTTIDALS